MVQKKIIFEKVDGGIRWALLLLLILIPYARGGMIPEVGFLTRAFIFAALAWIFFRKDPLKIDPIFYLFFLIVTLSFFLSPQKLLAARSWYAYISPVFFCLLFSWFLTQSEKQNPFILLIVINAVVLVFSAFLMSVGVLPDFFQGDITTVHGFYANKNHLSGYVEMAALLCLGQVLARKGLTVKISFSLLFLFFVMAVFLIGSRAGALSLGLAVVIVILLVFYPRTLRRRHLFFWLMTMAVIFSLFLYKMARQARESSSSVRVNAGESSWQDRASLNRSSLQMFQDHWVFGIGIGHYELRYPQYREAGMNRRIDYAHNDVLQFVVETGIGGLILLCGGLFCVFRWTFSGLKFFDSRPRDSRSRAAILGAIGALTAIFIHSFFDFNLQIPANAYTAGAVLALLYPSRSRGQ